MRFRTFPPLLVLAAIVTAIPAAAQFYPPRPPRDVDTAPDDQPPPQQYPQQYPPQQYPRQYPQQYPQQYPPSGGGVQSAPLPPPGASQPLPPPGPQGVPAQKGTPGNATVRDPNVPPQPAQKGKQKAAKQPPPDPGQPEAAEVPVQQEPIRRISNPTAVFSGLDKITGRIITFEVAMDETVQFGALRPFVRFFACEEDMSHEPPDAPLPDAVAMGAEPFLIVGAMAGG